MEPASGIVNPPTAFGIRLKEELLKINKTQAWLCMQPELKKLNIKPHTLTRMIRGERSFPDKEKVIMDFLNKYKPA